MFSWWNHLLSINCSSAGVWRAFSICILLYACIRKHTITRVLTYITKTHNIVSLKLINQHMDQSHWLLDWLWLASNRSYLFCFHTHSHKNDWKITHQKCIFSCCFCYNIFALSGPNHNLDLLLMRMYCKVFDIRLPFLCSNTLSLATSSITLQMCSWRQTNSK